MYTSPPDYVHTQEHLALALVKLSAGDFVAVDTEFLRERTYYPKLCLVQVAHDNYCALIDVLALQDASSLWDFLDNSTRTKVFHAARQDLEVLGLARGATQGKLVSPIRGPIFDTQVAAAFLNYPAQIGYADLVEKRLHHALAKGQSRTDWSQRPLSDAQLIYAADDVLYLVDLYHDLVRALRDTPGWNWIAADAALLEDPKLYVTDPIDAWQRLRGLEQLEPAQRAVAKKFAAWRERHAIEKDLPRGWILEDETLRQLAEMLPASIEELGAIRGISASLVKKRGDELLHLVADGIAAAAEEPEGKPFNKPSRDQMKQVTRLMDYVREQGTALGISPEILATRRDIERLVYSGKPGAFSEGWRGELFGTQLTALADEIKKT